MKCLITGVAGFIGSSLADELLKLGYQVVGIDAFVNFYPKEIKQANLKDALTNPNFKLVEGDLIKLDLVSLLDGVEYVFHQAAQAGVRSSWGTQFDEYTLNNVLATQRLLEAAKNSSSIKKVVYASSSSVYGDAEKYPTIETDLPKPRSPYGVTKLAAEHLMVLYNNQFNVPTVSLRYFTVYGPRQRPDMAFNRFIRAGLTKQPITVYGTGDQIRDFTYIKDIVDANIKAATEKTDPGAVFNLGGGTEISVNEVLQMLTDQIGPLNVVRNPPQPGDVFRTGADTTLAQKVLGFAPKVSLFDGIGQEIEWLKKTLS